MSRIRFHHLLLLLFAVAIGVIFMVPKEADRVSAAENSVSYWPLIQSGSTPTPTPTLTPSPTPTPPPGWTEEYFPNTNMSGYPTYTRVVDYAYPAYDWGGGAPMPGMSADDFSVRFTGTKYFAAGYYDFYATADDGVRMYIDTDGNSATPLVLVIDDWGGRYRGEQLGGTATRRWFGWIPEGNHEIRLEYREATGDARVRLFWVNDDLSAHWRAEYWNNDSMSGAPVLVRPESELDHDWAYSSPGPNVPADHFSARWTRAFWIPEGSYVFFARADDAVRVWVDRWTDPANVIGDWSSGEVREHSNYLYLAGDPSDAGRGAWYLVTVTYREDTGLASCEYEHVYGGSKDKFVGEYYDFVPNNPTNRPWGTPKVIRMDNPIAFNWKGERPTDGMPKDYFSVRWLGTFYTKPGAYRFTATVDDGCRVYIDGYDNLLIDEWRGGGVRDVHGDIVLSGGYHIIIMEYYEASGDAVAQLKWGQTDEMQVFRADYWNGFQKGGEDEGEYVEFMEDLNVDIGLDSPGPGISASDWSARFKQFMNFEDAGVYEFRIEYNGGASLYVDGAERINRWYDTGYHVDTYTQYMSKGQHWIKLHYADKSSGGVNQPALVRLTVTRK